MLRIIQRVDHLRHQFVLLGDLEHRPSILVPSTVVCGRENCEQLTPRESLETIHNTLVRSQHKSAPVRVEEVLDAVGAEFDNVTSSIWVANKVWLNAQILIAICRVRPENINDELLFRR